MGESQGRQSSKLLTQQRLCLTRHFWESRTQVAVKGAPQCSPISRSLQNKPLASRLVYHSSEPTPRNQLALLRPPRIVPSAKATSHPRPNRLRPHSLQLLTTTSNTSRLLIAHRRTFPGTAVIQQYLTPRAHHVGAAGEQPIPRHQISHSVCAAIPVVPLDCQYIIAPLLSSQVPQRYHPQT